MDREELTKRIAVGSAYMQRPGLTDEQRRMAAMKVERYREQLRELETERVPTEEDVAKANENIEKIRMMLDGAKPRRRAL